MTKQTRAACALRSAKTLAEWREAERAGLVRLVAEPEREDYFAVFGREDNEKYQKAMEQTLERDGCWHVFSQVNHGSESGDKWVFADGVGMCVYRNPLDPFENDYVIDLMRSALDKVPQPGNVDEVCATV